MKRAAALAFAVLVSCATVPQRHASAACQTALDALQATDEARGDPIATACGRAGYVDVTACPEYQDHRAAFDAAALALEPCK